MDYARDVAKYRQKNINPELRSKPYLQKHAQRWEKDRDNEAQQIHYKPPSEVEPNQEPSALIVPPGCFVQQNAKPQLERVCVSGTVW